MTIDLHEFPISRHNLQLKLGKTELPVDNLSLKIIKAINQHTRVWFSLPIKEPGTDQKMLDYLDELLGNTTLDINLINLPPVKNNKNSENKGNSKNENQEEKPRCLFTGLITKLDIKVVNLQYHLTGEALSYTYKLDIQKKKRSFQNKELPFNELIKQVTAKYGSKIVHSRIPNEQKQTRIAVQYEETDWEFLLRMASRLFEVIVPSEIDHEQWLIFGMPEGKTYTLPEACYHDYEIIRELQKYRQLSANQNWSWVSEKTAICYRINNTHKYLTIGDRVIFPVGKDGHNDENTKRSGDSTNNNQNNRNENSSKEERLIVKQVEAVLDEHQFCYSYILTSEAGLKQPKQVHPKITGVSIEGKVLDVQGDQIKLHLYGIDESQDPKQAAWFPYASAYTAEMNTGWYVMPEKGDYVKLYFPTNNEADAIAIGSIRRVTKAPKVLIKEHFVKYLRTAHGKEIKFSPDEILISGYGAADDKQGLVSVKLNETSGITIQSANSDIVLYSNGELRVKSDGNLKLAAGNRLNIHCKTNSIEMAGATYFKGLIKDN